MLSAIGLIALALAGAQDARPAPGDRLNTCMDLASSAPARGEIEATGWRLEGGGFLARQCLGIALANQNRWSAAAAAFEAAADEAKAAGDTRASELRAQAGNAWLAAGNVPKALAALDAALAEGEMPGLGLGEIHLDRARARVAAGDLAGARVDLDLAVLHASEDPLSWLLSATLARRTGDLDRAKRDIAEAVRRSGEDPSVQLEAGNIAALSGDAGAARTAWQRVIALAPGSPATDSANAALAQFAP